MALKYEWKNKGSRCGAIIGHNKILEVRWMYISNPKPHTFEYELTAYERIVVDHGVETKLLNTEIQTLYRGSHTREQFFDLVMLHACEFGERQIESPRDIIARRMREASKNEPLVSLDAGGS